MGRVCGHRRACGPSLHRLRRVLQFPLLLLLAAGWNQFPVMLLVGPSTWSAYRPKLRAPAANGRRWGDPKPLLQAHLVLFPVHPTTAARYGKRSVLPAPRTILTT